MAADVEMENAKVESTDSKQNPAPEVESEHAPEQAPQDSPGIFGRPEPRVGFLTESACDVLYALGEDPGDYNRMMKALWDDLQPREGLESQLVEQIGETFWRMQRIRHMRDGIAQRDIQRQMDGEGMVVTLQASKAIEALKPFERLEKALTRRGQPPTAQEINEFAESGMGDQGRKAELIELLNSLGQAGKDGRAAIMRKARRLLRAMMGPFETLAWQHAHRVERLESPEGLAAMMTFDRDPKSEQLNRMEDSLLRRLWRLINALEKVRAGALKKRRCPEEE